MPDCTQTYNLSKHRNKHQNIEMKPSFNQYLRCSPSLFAHSHCHYLACESNKIFTYPIFSVDIFYRTFSSLVKFRTQDIGCSMPRSWQLETELLLVARTNRLIRPHFIQSGFKHLNSSGWHIQVSSIVFHRNAEANYRKHSRWEWDERSAEIHLHFLWATLHRAAGPCL